MNRRYKYDEPFKVVALQLKEGFEQPDCSGTSEATCTPVYTAKPGGPPIRGGCRWVANEDPKQSKCYPNTINPDIACPFASSEKNCANVGVYPDNKPVCTWVKDHQQEPDSPGPGACLKYQPGPVCFNTYKVPTPTPQRHHHDHRHHDHGHDHRHHGHGHHGHGHR